MTGISGLIFSISQSPANAGTIQISESSPDWSWNYSGNFADQRFAVSHIPGGGLWINPDVRSNIPADPSVPVGSSFKGVAFFFYTFSLPSNISDVSLNLQASADDQVAVDLNGNGLGVFKLFLNNPTSPVAGKFTNANFGQYDVNFLPNFTPVSVNDPTEFNQGLNVLRFAFNNTNTAGNPNAIAIPIQPGGDGSILGASGTITYNSKPVPVPAIVPGVILAGAFGAWRIRKQKYVRA